MELAGRARAGRYEKSSLIAAATPAIRSGSRPDTPCGSGRMLTDETLRMPVIIPREAYDRWLSPIEPDPTCGRRRCDITHMR
jgi:hypothetical protein